MNGVIEKALRRLEGGEEVPKECGESDGDCGRRTGFVDEEIVPAEEKAPDTPEALAKVDVRTPGLRQHGAEFGERQGAEQRQHPCNDPHQHDRTHRLEMAGNRRGNNENARADDDAHVDRDSLAQAESAEKLRLWGWFGHQGVCMSLSVYEGKSVCAIRPSNPLGVASF